MPKDLLGRKLKIGQKVIFLHVVDLQVEEMAGDVISINDVNVGIKLDGSTGWRGYTHVARIYNEKKSAHKIVIIKDVQSPSIDSVIRNRFDLLDL